MYSKKLMNVSIIGSSLVLLGMSFGFLPQSAVVLFILFVGQFVLNMASLERMTKEELLKISKGSMVENFMAEGPIVGPIRLVLFWTLIATLLTFNMFAWYIFVLFYVLSGFILKHYADKFGIDLTKDD